MTIVTSISRLRVAAVAAIGAAVLAGCGSEGTADGTSDPGIGAEGTEPGVLVAGAPIADGFVVADGTTVPGGAFPTTGVQWNGDPSTRSWVAVVQSELDLPELLASYVQQAIDLGYRVPGFAVGVDASAAADAGCSVNLAQDNSDQPHLPPQPPVGAPLFVSCTASGEKVVDGQIQQVYISGERSYPVAAAPVDVFTLSLTRHPASRGTGPILGEPSELDAAMLGNLPAAPPMSTVPEVTEGATGIECTATRIEPGSRVIGMGFDCSWGSFEIVTEVTGAPAQVFDAYVEQLGAADGYNPPVRHDDPAEFDGRQMRRASIYGDDGSYLRVTMLTGGDAPPTLLISHMSG